MKIVVPGLGALVALAVLWPFFGSGEGGGPASWQSVLLLDLAWADGSSERGIAVAVAGAAGVFLLLWLLVGFAQRRLQ